MQVYRLFLIDQEVELVLLELQVALTLRFLILDHVLEKLEVFVDFLQLDDVVPLLAVVLAQLDAGCFHLLQLLVFPDPLLFSREFLVDVQLRLHVF